METDVKPFLRWAGSKQKILHKLSPHWNSDIHQRYVEPFMGSASLFFNIQPGAALMSDINQELVDTFLCVRDHPKAVFNRYSTLPVGEEEYYEIRQQDPNGLSNLDRSARFIYLNRFCFNGIYRTNLKGKFNVPYGNKSKRTGRLPSLSALMAVSKTLQNADIKCKHFVDILKDDVCKNDFVYLDPPYAVQNRRIFRQYGPETFGMNDIQNLEDQLRNIDQKGAYFLVSYAMCKEALDIFSEWDIKRVTTQRNVSGFAKHRRRAVELLITNII